MVWYTRKYFEKKWKAAQISERELCAEDRSVPLPRGIKQEPPWELSSQSWVRLGQALVPVRPRNAPLLGDQGQHCLQAPPWGLGGEVATNISDTYVFGRRGEKCPLPWLVASFWLCDTREMPLPRRFWGSQRTPEVQPAPLPKQRGKTMDYFTPLPLPMCIWPRRLHYKRYRLAQTSAPVGSYLAPLPWLVCGEICLDWGVPGGIPGGQSILGGITKGTGSLWCSVQ